MRKRAIRGKLSVLDKRLNVKVDLDAVMGPHETAESLWVVSASNQHTRCKTKPASVSFFTASKNPVVKPDVEIVANAPRKLTNATISDGIPSTNS